MICSAIVRIPRPARLMCRRPRKGLWFAMSKGDNSCKQGNEVETFNIPAMHPVLLVVSLCSCHGSRRIRDDCLVPVCLVRTLSSLRMSVAAAQREPWQIASQGYQLSASPCKYRTHK